MHNKSTCNCQTHREASLLSRRDLLKWSAAAGAGLTLTEYLGVSSLLAQQGGRARSCIVLWMQGGPSQLDTWDPKPGQRTSGGVPVIERRGIQVAAELARVAEHMDALAIVRSMSSPEGDHDRARYLLHTGYQPFGSIAHPSLGALVAKALLDQGADLPPFVSIATSSFGPGILGSDFVPFVVRDPVNVQNLTPQGGSLARFDQREGLLGVLQQGFAADRQSPEVRGHQEIVRKAIANIRGRSREVFDLSRETDAVRQAYGTNGFGQGCLLARRLVESGVKFVEVSLDGWDTHEDNTNRVIQLKARLDPAMAMLIKELKDKGLLDSTLVVWMGDFGRTPNINSKNGRDHFPRGFSVALAGGGVKGGQVVGATSADGTRIDTTRRVVPVADLFASVCHAVGLDPAGVNTSPIGQKIPITDEGKIVTELFPA